MAEAIRVLYVDDESDLLDIGRLFLEESGNFTVTTALSATNAIGLLEQGKFDAIISDYQMPGMDGIQFLVEVRTRIGQVPFILFTGRGREEVVIQAINSGADFYLQKGGEPEAQFAELSHKIKKAVEGRRAEEADRASRNRLISSETDLRSHKTELEAQAAELRRSKIALEESRDKYLDLYDFSPLGYLTLSDKALITEANLTGATLLGVERSKLIKERFSKFIAEKDTDEWHRYFLNLLNQEEKRSFTLMLIRRDGSLFSARLEGIRITGSKGTTTVRIAFTDISDITHTEQTLRESEEKFRTLTESSPDYIMRYDRQCRHTYMNPAALRVSGRTEKQIIGKTHRESGFDEAQSRFYEDKITGVFESGRPFQTQFAWESPGGRVVLDWMLTPEFSEDGTVRSVLGVSRDITQLKKAEDELLRKNEELHATYEEITATEEELRSNLVELSRQEQALRESDSSLRAILDATPFPVALVDLQDNNINYWSSSALNLFGHTAPTAPGWYQLAYPDPAYRQDVIDRWKPFLEKAKLSGQPVNTGEYMVTCRDGSVRICELYATFLADKLVVTFNDITERKRSELELTSAQEQVNEAHRLAHIGTWDWVMKTDTVTWSEELFNIAGRDPSQPAPTYAELPRIYTPASWERLSAAVANALTTGEPYNLELELIRPDGSMRWTHAFGGIVRDMTGKVTGLYGTVQDITERKQAEEVLAETNAYLNNLFDYANAPIIVWDPNFVITRFNHAFEDLTLISAQEIIGQRLDILFPKESREISLIQIKKTLEGERWEIVEIPILVKDGSVRTVIWNSANILDPEGRIISTIAQGVDITEGKRGEAALAESFATFSTVMDSLDALVYAADMKTHEILFVNQYGRKIWGDLTGKICWKSLQVNQQGPCQFCTNERLLDEDGNPAGIVIWEFKNTINGHWYECHDSAIRWTDGRIVRIEIATDITDRKQVDEVRRRSEERFQGLFDTITSGVAIYEVRNDGASGKDYIIKNFNKTALEIEGKKKDEVIGKSLFDLRPAIDDYGLIPVFQQVWVTGVPAYFPQKVYIDEKYSHWYENRVFRLQSGEIVAVYDDVTERKHADDKLALASRKLSLLSSITRHDINNQLTVLTGFLKILEKKQTDPILLEYFGKVTTAAERISSTIRFTREYEEIGVKAPAWQDCRTLMGTAEKQVPPGQVVVKNDLPAGIEVFADPLIVKVFYNLMDNAVRHGGKITTIRFFVEEHEGDHVVVCEDNGDGVAAKEKEKIFERGFGKNTGMGLFLSREILDITGIMIKETGEPGKGARFEMVVPKGMYHVNTNADQTGQ